MTSTYNISRRSKKELYSPTNWGAHQKQFGICPPNHLTVPIKQYGTQCSDWKFCVPLENEEGMPATFPVMKDMLPKEGECTNGKRHFTSNLYNLKNHIEQSPMNLYPPHSRRPDREELDQKDYFRLPVKFDGTGYYPVRSWDYPEYPTDNIKLEDEWSKFNLIQRRDLQKQTQREYEIRQKLNLKPYHYQYLGTFYKN